MWDPVFHESDSPLPSAATSDRGKKRMEWIPAHSLAWWLIGWKYLSAQHKLVMFVIGNNENDYSSQSPNESGPKF